MNKIKLLSLDMDGTTYFKMGEVVPANVAPIQKAIAQGVVVVFATGRPPLAGPNKLLENGFVGNNSLLIAHNGGVVYDVATQKIVKKNVIKPQIAFQVFSLLKDPAFKDAILWGYVDDLTTMMTNAIDPQSKTNKPDYYVLEMNFFDGQYVQIDPENLTNLQASFFKFIVFDGSEAFFTELRKMGLEVSSGDGVTAEVTAHQVNKKTALQWLGEELRIDAENMMAIGDGANDLAMIEYVGVGVAIKNSIPLIRQKANLYVDLTNKEGAVGYVIENYVLKKEKI